MNETLEQARERYQASLREANGPYTVHRDTLSGRAGAGYGHEAHEVHDADGVAVKRGLPKWQAEDLAQKLSEHPQEKHSAIMQNFREAPTGGPQSTGGAASTGSGKKGLLQKIGDKVAEIFGQAGGPAPAAPMTAAPAKLGEAEDAGMGEEQMQEADATSYDTAKSKFASGIQEAAKEDDSCCTDGADTGKKAYKSPAEILKEAHEKFVGGLKEGSKDDLYDTYDIAPKMGQRVGRKNPVPVGPDGQVPMSILADPRKMGHRTAEVKAKRYEDADGEQIEENAGCGPSMMQEEAPTQEGVQRVESAKASFLEGVLRDAKKNK